MNPFAAFERKLNPRRRVFFKARRPLIEAARAEAKAKGRTLSQHMEFLIEAKLNL